MTKGRRLFNSLNTRITLPVISLVFFVWIGLNLSVFQAVDEFQNSRIQEDMSWGRRFTYNLVNDQLVTLIRSGSMDDERRLRITQGRSIGALEEFAREKGFVAVVYAEDADRFLLDGGLPVAFIKTLESSTEEDTLGRSGRNGKEYYHLHFKFEPWNWHIILLKNVSAYAALVERVRYIYMATGVVLVLAALLLYFSLRWNIHRPLRQIMESLSGQGRPQYTGIDEFEYLSTSIDNMVSTIEEREQFLAGVFDSIQDGISILDMDMTVVRVNKTMERWYAHNPDLVGRKCYEVYHGRTEECDPCPSRHTIDAGVSSEELVPRIGEDGEVTGHLMLYTFPLVDQSTGRQKGVIEYVRDVTEQVITEKALNETRERFQVAFQANPDPMVIVRLSDRTIVDVNESFVTSTGYTAQRIIGMRSEETPYWSRDESRKALYETVKNRGRVDNMETEFRLDSGEFRPGLLSARSISLSGEPHLLVLVKDISQIKAAQEQLRSSLAEKDVLLKEIHHRVKNNLQVVSGLLNLQAQHLDDPTGRAAFKESQNRVVTMALIHEDLYQSAELSSVDLGVYIKELAVNLFASYSIGQDKVGLALDVEQTAMVVDTAIPCGLIINELLSNALKHAFPGDRKGTVTVRFQSDGDKSYVLEVTDDGVGLPAELEVVGGESLGLQLVTVIVDQLGGTLEVTRDKGTSFRIAFDEYLEAGSILY